MGEIPGLCHSDGDVRNDLVNLLPLAVRVGPFLSAWRNAATIKVRCGIGGVGRLRRCYSNVSYDGALDFVKSDVQTAGSSPEPLRSTGLGMLGRNGDVLSDVGVGGVTSGFVLLEASVGSFSDAVELVVEIGGQEVYAYTPTVSFCDVDDMYRWRNIRAAAGGTCADTASPEGNDGPPGRPDSECDGTHVVFLHGYNVNEREARAWARAVFKRLWWADMESAFTAVTWRGDDGQTTLAYNVITPDYQRNVEHAFASASNLAVTVNSLPGRKFMMAHSLGNMLVSAARQDQGLQYEKYFMVNAAVPVEAYDAVNGVTALSKAGMTNPEWVGYPDRVRASHWWELFPASDGRRLLTWTGRFAIVTDTVNYYSSEDEVLVDGDGTLPNFPRRYRAWSDQEMWKGNKPLTDILYFSMGRNEAGWGFNADHDVYEQPLGLPAPTTLRRRTPSETTNITDAILRECPFFRHFANRNIYTSTNGNVILENAAYRAQLLADAIPVESFATGANPVPVWVTGIVDVRNIDMATKCKDNRISTLPWLHSFFISAPYMCVHGLYEDIVSRIPKEIPNE